jgi:hypothetical protein
MPYCYYENYYMITISNKTNNKTYKKLAHQ